MGSVSSKTPSMSKITWRTGKCSFKAYLSNDAKISGPERGQGRNDFCSVTGRVHFGEDFGDLALPVDDERHSLGVPHPDGHTVSFRDLFVVVGQQLER